MLAGDRGAYRLAGSIQTLQLPATAQAMLAARIDRLEPDDKRPLQAASVIGKDVPLPLLAAIADLPEDRLRDGLARLRTTEFLYEARLFPEIEYTFKHALTHEVAYGGLLQDQRRTLHARIVQVVESVDPDRLSDHAELLGHHALRCEAWDKAVSYLRQAGSKALARAAALASVACYEQALEALGRLPESREVIERAVDLRLEMRGGLWTLGQFERTLERLREAQPLAERLGDRRRLGSVLCLIGNCHWIVGAHNRALDPTQTARAMAEDLGDEPLLAMTNFYLGLIHRSLGDFHRAADLFRQNVEVPVDAPSSRPFGLPAMAVLSGSLLSRCLTMLGAFEEGLGVAARALEAAEAAGRAFEIAYACSAMGDAHVYRTEFQSAILVLERGLELCETWGFRLILPGTACALGYAHVLSGRVDRGMSVLERGVDLASGRANTVQLIMFGEASLVAGRRDDAMTAAARALEFSRTHQERANEAWALRLLGEIASHGDPTESTAEASYGHALALAEELGMRPLAARCHLGLGHLRARAGRRDQAVFHLATASTMFSEMGMRSWLEHAQAEIKRLA